MPAKPNLDRLAGLPDDHPVQATLVLDAGTLRGLDAMLGEIPDLTSRSAAVRKLVRERRKPRSAKS